MFGEKIKERYSFPKVGADSCHFLSRVGRKSAIRED